MMDEENNQKIVTGSDSNETLTFEKSEAANAAIETISSSSSSSILPLSLEDENTKLSELNLNPTQQQQQQDQTAEKKDEIYKENILAENFQQFFEPLIQNLDSNVSTLRTSQIELGAQIDLLANR
jgi:hypothetical protein